MRNRELPDSGVYRSCWDVVIHSVSPVMAIFWPVVFGMMAVNRMLLNINVGEEDRQSTIDIMLVVLVGFAESWTRLFFRDPSDPVYGMTISAFRILPLCMPFSEDERPVFGECP